MNEMIISLIIVQAILVAVGYAALANEIRDTRRRIEVLAALVFVMPLLIYALKIISNLPISDENVLVFFEFYVYSVIGNSISGAIVRMVESILLDRKGVLIC